MNRSLQVIYLIVKMKKINALMIMGIVNNNNEDSLFIAYVDAFHDCDVVIFMIEAECLDSMLDKTNDMKEMLFPYNDGGVIINNNDNFDFFFIFSYGEIEH